MKLKTVRCMKARTAEPHRISLPDMQSKPLKLNVQKRQKGFCFMFDSPFSIMVFSVFPIFFIFRFAYLAENESFCNLIDCLNEKYGKFFIIATLCCTLFTLYLDQSGQTDFMENPVSLGIVYFLVLTASNLRVYDGFGIVFMLVGNVVVYAALERELFDAGGIYYVFVFNVLYCIYSLIFINLHHIMKFLDIKILEKK